VTSPRAGSSIGTGWGPWERRQLIHALRTPERWVPIQNAIFVCGGAEADVADDEKTATHALRLRYQSLKIAVAVAYRYIGCKTGVRCGDTWSRSFRETSPKIGDSRPPMLVDTNAPHELE